MILKGTKDDDLTLKYLLEKNKGSGGGGSGDVPEPAEANPLMDSVAFVGASDKYAREDHIHPHDTTRITAHVGPNAPTDPSAKIWLDTDEQGMTATFVSKGGDIMTGSLTVADQVVVKTNTPTTTPVNNTFRQVVDVTNSHNERMGYVQSAYLNDGRRGICLEAAREINGVYAYNGVQQYLDANGTPTTYFHSPSAWRNGLGVAPNIYTTHSSPANSITTTTSVTIDSTSYTTRTGRYVVIVSVPLKTSANTSVLRITINGTNITYCPTNQTTYMNMVSYCVRDTTVGATETVATVITAQTTSTTATVPGYCHRGLLIFDIPKV